MPFAETGRTVGTHIHFQQVAAQIIVIETSEHTYCRPFVARSVRIRRDSHTVFRTGSHIDFRFRVDNQAIPLQAEFCLFQIFYLHTCHHVEVMLLGDRKGVFRTDIEVIIIILQVIFVYIRAFIREIGRSVHVIVVIRQLVPMTVCRLNTVVEIHIRHPVLDRLDGKAQLMIGIVCLRAVGTTVFQCPNGSAAVRIIRCSVLIVCRNNRPRFISHRLIKPVGRSDRTFLVFTRETHRIAESQPRSQFGIQFSGCRIAFQVLFSQFQRTVLVEETTRSIISELVTATADTDIVFLRKRPFLIQ